MAEAKAHKGGLLATFYGEGAAVDALIPSLVRAWTLSADGPDFWRSPQESLGMRRFIPIVNGDTAVLQVTLPASDPLPDGWVAARCRLEAAIDPQALEAPALWGYTLVYQAVLKEAGGEETAPEALLPEAHRLFGDEEEVVPVLASGSIPGGYLWLAEIPLGDAVQAATVYMALSQPERERDMNRWLVSRTAPLLNPDLVAHKGYELRRQYLRHNNRDRYHTLVTDLTRATRDLLNDRQSGRASEAQLDIVATLYDGVVTAVPVLDQLRIRLVTQLKNFEYWAAAAGGARTVMDYHQAHLSTALQEVELMVAQGRDAMEAAATTIDVVQARLSTQRARQERRLEGLLALAGLSLALVELIDRSVAAWVLDIVRPWFDRAALGEGAYTMGSLLFVQLAIILAVGLGIYAIVRLVTPRQ